MAQTEFFAAGSALNDPSACWLEHALAPFFDREDIPGRTKCAPLYMRRFFLNEYDDGSVRCLHVFHRGDEDPDPHDHPWRFRTRCLWGGYLDETYVRDKIFGRVLTRSAEIRMGQSAEREATHIHRVRLLRPGRKTVTLVRMWPKERDWFFYTASGPVPQREYLRRTE